MKFKKNQPVYLHHLKAYGTIHDTISGGYTVTIFDDNKLPAIAQNIDVREEQLESR